jgi:RNA recognition motif-containing protein
LEEAENALEQTKGKTLNNRRLRVEKARVNRTLFLAKLPKQLTSQVKNQIFRKSKTN